jgi:DNA-directed RNA polymerase specialized sigma subunit
MSQDGGGGKGNGADIGNLICRLEKYEIIVQKEITKLVTLKAKARHIIEYLDDGKARAVLHNRYLNNMTWEQIAVEMGYSWRQMHRVHAAALRQLDSDKRVQRIKKMS